MAGGAHILRKGYMDVFGFLGVRNLCVAAQAQLSPFKVKQRGVLGRMRLMAREAATLNRRVGIFHPGYLFTVTVDTEVVSAAHKQIRIFRIMRIVACRAHPLRKWIVVLVSSRPQAL